MQILKSPTSAGVGVVVALGFFGGVIFWGEFNTTLEMTNTEEFCIGCHKGIAHKLPDMKGVEGWH